MNIEFVGRGYEVNDVDRNLAEDKLRKVVKFLDEPIEIHITLEKEKHRHIADLNIHHRHGSLQAHDINTEMPDAIHLVIDKAERQARRAKEKFQGRRRRAQRTAEEQLESSWPVEVVDATSLGSGGGHRVIKASRIRIKPMSIEEAALDLDSSRNDFVVFRDAETDQVSVLYKRRDGNYGLIAPGR